MAIHQATTIETKALCSVLRKAESHGERALVEKMIEICDPQSGLRFEEIWDWWKKHKAQDSVKSKEIIIDFMRDLQQIGLPHKDYRVTC